MTSFEKVELLRKEQKLSRSKLERLAELGSGSIGKWRTSNPKRSTLIKVAKVLNVTYESLVDDENPSYELPLYVLSSTNSQSSLSIIDKSRLSDLNDLIAIRIDSSEYEPKYLKNDLLIVKTNPDLANANDVIVETDGRMHIYTIVSSNQSQYAMIPLVSSSIPTKSIKVIGKIIELRRTL